MATFEELKDRVSSMVSDSSIVTNLVPDLINQGVNEIAGGMLSNVTQVITPPLPELFKIDTVDTSTTDAYVAMPSDFQRNLQFAVKENGSEVDIANSFIEFSETDPTMSKTGIISEVIEHGKYLYYSRIPSTSEELTLHYYREPTDMVNNSDEPDGIPEHLQFALLTNFAAWKAYEFIERGIEGDNLNTIKYHDLFFNALHTLELTIPDYTRGLELL